ALRHGAGVEQETTDPQQAYARFPTRERTRYREGWLVSPSNRLGSRGHRRSLGRVGDLANDLDDVSVRVERAPLAVGAVAPRQDLTDSFELLLRAQLASMRLDVAQRAADELGDRDAVPPAGREIHHRRLEPVAGGEPLVLGRQDPVVGRDLLAAVVALAVMLNERLAVRRQRNGVLDPGDRVADPDLDGAEARMQSDVPPDVRVVRDAAGLLELADHLCVVGVVLEARRGPRAREGGEDRLPARR